jgi:hypothetical protein
MATVLLVVLGTGLSAAVAVGVWLVRKRNMQYWLPAHVASLARRRPAGPARHVHFCFADHYEPYGGTRDRERAHRRVALWLEKYPELARRHHDSDGRPPQHSFFYPEEEYDPELLDQLAGLRRAGLGDVEVHLHHDGDTADNLRATLCRYVETLHRRHGLLRCDASGRPVYAFIHGNWALDNSRPDGRWCGVDGELDVLVETGCRVDMTMPSAPSDTQTTKINSLYFARGRKGVRKAHDRGRDVAVGAWAEPGELLLVQGPLTLNWRQARWGVLPKIESAELSADAPPNAHRVALWGRCRIAVRGAEEHVFVKVHTHGATEASTEMLFGGGFETLWSELERQYRDRPGCALHYVTAWEMYERIRGLASPAAGA